MKGIALRCINKHFKTFDRLDLSLLIKHLQQVAIRSKLYLVGTNAGLCEVMIFFGCNFRPRGTVGQASWLVARAHDPYRTYFCNPFGHGNFSYFMYCFQISKLVNSKSTFLCTICSIELADFRKETGKYLIKKQTFALYFYTQVQNDFGPFQIILDLSKLFCPSVWTGPKMNFAF